MDEKQLVMTLRNWIEAGDEVSTIFHHLSQGVLIANLDGNIVYANTAFSSMSGYDISQVMNKTPYNFSASNHYHSLYVFMFDQLRALNFWQDEIWIRKKDGSAYPLLLMAHSLKDKEGKPFCYVLIYSEISFLKEDYQKTMPIALYDPLTSLPSRFLFKDRFEQMATEKRREQYYNQGNKSGQTAICCVNINQFKQINENYGYAIGDLLLKHVASGMVSHSRKVNTIARMEVDEFMMLMPDLQSEENVTHFINRIFSYFKSPIILNEQAIAASLSVGVVYFPSEVTSYAAAIDAAKRVMRHAKLHDLGISFYDEL